MATARKTSRKMQVNERGGFTIIEVVLVLAIAGLIFLMVFIALPTLQRSQRDTQRRNDLARISTQITQYQTNNNGRLPGDGSVEPSEELNFATLGWCESTSSTTSNPAECFIRNYMNGVGAVENEFVDPDGWGYGLEIAEFSDTVTLSDFDHVVYIYKHAKCEGETAVESENSRDYVVMYKLEGSGTYCQDNQ